MEILTVILSGLLSLTASGGVILDSVAANKISAQIESLDHLAVRIENTPNYAVAQGKIQKIRVAARNIQLQPDLNVAVLELETDQVHLSPAKLDLSNVNTLRNSLKKSLQGVGKVELTETSLNQALQSPELLAQVQKNFNRLIARKAGSTNIAYELSNIHFGLNSNNQVEVRFKLARAINNFESDARDFDTSKNSSNSTRELLIALKLKIKVLNGKNIKLTEAQGTVNGRPMSSRLLNGFAEGISDRLDLTSLESDGILARILQLKISDDKLKLVGFVKLETKATRKASEEIKVAPKSK